MHCEPRVASLMRVEERDDLVRAFEARLVESSTLAFRVAYGVLRHREDAEDVAQEAFAKAYRSFRQLRDRDRFRAWLVRMTWRMAIDRMRTNRRRGAHEVTVDPGDNDPEPQSGRTPEQTAEAEERSAHLCTAGEAAMADENRTMNDQSIDRALREALDVSAARRWRAIRRRV
jgi:RNA polymerase sigma factor (sigma-70 family)